MSHLTGTVVDECRAQSARSGDWRDVTASAWFPAGILSGYLYSQG